ncbi:PRKC apoptosis WT1 regulator protein [Merluccius polli]|uniref:PRKC apoptosis WT1 regulator protein n=1 Tax=Merluccius polli TaxID=89951 RepID=A0AA47N8M1_MERPO|nr:PRKC apoptosis WT1 regulator protein [Merluccius polli]
MATGGFKPNATTDFLEEWKAKREKMRAKMLGDIAAATGACAGNAAAATGAPSGAPMGVANTNTNGNKSGPSAELHHHNNNNNGNPGSSCPPIARSQSSSALKKGPEEEGHPAGGHLKKSQEKEREKEKCAPCAPCASLDSSPSAGLDSDPMESPSPAKGKEKRGAGPSARKGKGQIEKRKLREKRRSTGVVSLPSNECQIRQWPASIVLYTINDAWKQDGWESRGEDGCARIVSTLVLLGSTKELSREISAQNSRETETIERCRCNDVINRPVCSPSQPQRSNQSDTRAT